MARVGRRVATIVVCGLPAVALFCRIDGIYPRTIYCLTVPCSRLLDDYEWSIEQAHKTACVAAGIALIAGCGASGWVSCTLRRQRWVSWVSLVGAAAGVWLTRWPSSWDDVRWSDAVRPRNALIVRLNAAEARVAVSRLVPAVDPCTRGPWCHLRDVCVSGRDGLLVPDIGQLNVSLRRRFDAASGWWTPSFKCPRGASHDACSVVNLRLAPPSAILNRTRVYHVAGETAMVSCWRQIPRSRTSPAHALYGFGALFEGENSRHGGLRHTDRARTRHTACACAQPSHDCVLPCLSL